MAYRTCSTGHYQSYCKTAYIWHIDRLDYRPHPGRETDSNPEEQTWRAEEWWRVHESTFPMTAMLAKRVLATQVCPRVHEHLWLVSARTMGHCTVIAGV